jgi:c-di-GMP-binding flagellar brake protein YcgR
VKTYQKLTDKKPALWERVSVSLDRNGRASRFISRIENIKKSSYVLEMPVRQNGNSNLEKGDIVEISYNRKDAAYTFKASIKDLFLDEPGSVEIEKEGDIKRNQRRKYVRLDISEEINFRIIDSPRDPAAGISPEFRGSLLNISAGGFLFETDTPAKEGSLLIVNFRLKDRYSLENILAVVKRVEQAGGESSLVGSEFITRDNRAEYDLEKLDDFLPQGIGTFDENLQKLIVQFIYKQQVKLRKDGKL